VHYQIRVRGVLGSGWSAWFAGLRLTSDEHGETSIAEPITDQAALHGLLAKVRDLGLEFLEVRRIDPMDEETKQRDAAGSNDTAWAPTATPPAAPGRQTAAARGDRTTRSTAAPRPAGSCPTET
jgi:hypothetical protein